MARTRRALNPNNGSGFYHIICRTVGGEFLLGAEEKEVFTSIMRKTAAFTGIEIITHVVMSNHYHILLEVPQRKELNEKEILARYKAQVSETQYQLVVRELEQDRKMGNELAAMERLCGITARMYTLSRFMQAVNQSMTQWYNRKHNRYGPLWAGRYKSLIVEGDGHPLMTLAAYIDLNPIRAGIVKKPEEYRWSGYGEAVAGRAKARAGLSRLVAIESGAKPWGEAASEYRRLLFFTGVETDKRHGITRKQVAETLATGGELSLNELLHCRIRYFSAGVAIGRRAFLDKVFAENRGVFGKRRSHGPRPMQGGVIWGGLMTLRTIRLAPVS